MLSDLCASLKLQGLVLAHHRLLAPWLALLLSLGSGGRAREENKQRLQRLHSSELKYKLRHNSVQYFAPPLHSVWQQLTGVSHKLGAFLDLN
ncbi:hypothetical protein E2320_010154 [Naja naja]|nr:hypothetical protein E2320_010154 [Naja naja]